MYGFYISKLVKREFMKHAKRKIAFDFHAIPLMVQHYLTNVHVITGMPWWSAIALSTVLLRISMFPIVRFQIIGGSKLALSIRDITVLTKLFYERVSPANNADNEEKKKLFGAYVKGVRASILLNEVPLARMVTSPLISITVFATFIYSIRDMIVSDVAQDMSTGGFLMFTDLTVRDSSFVVPLVSLALSYLSFELSFRTHGQYILVLKDLLQSLLVLSIPFVLPLQLGVFCYWIPSSLFTITQTLLLRTPAFRRLVRLPPQPSSAATQAAAKL